MNVSFDIEFYYTIVLPPICRYCTENPLTINRAKMRAASALPEKPKISHIQLAWMQAVTEFDFQAFDSIPPWDTNLIARVNSLQESFRLILADAFISDPEKYGIKKELPLGEMDAGKNVIYQIPLSTAIQLLHTVLNQQKHKKSNNRTHKRENKQCESYRGDIINITVVTNILPNLFPQKDQVPSKELGWYCFEALPKALNNIGARVSIHSSSNRKDVPIPTKWITDSEGMSLPISSKIR